METGNGTHTLWLDYNNAGGIKCGTEYCVYPTKEQGYTELEMLVMRYYLKYGIDFKSWREEYCGLHCGEQDLNTFIEIYNEEMERETHALRERY
ncbi:glucosaminidase domain-containing protein [Erysipelothrix sp. HDW6A]|nr:glucosaminidase domain-containing protein [Erysipelothrix sp. HDW6A]